MKRNALKFLNPFLFLENKDFSPKIKIKPHYYKKRVKCTYLALFLDYYLVDKSSPASQNGQIKWFKADPPSTQKEKWHEKKIRRKKKDKAEIFTYRLLEVTVKKM